MRNAFPGAVIFKSPWRWQWFCSSVSILFEVTSGKWAFRFSIRTAGFSLMQSSIHTWLPCDQGTAKGQRDPLWPWGWSSVTFSSLAAWPDQSEESLPLILGIPRGWDRSCDSLLGVLALRWSPGFLWNDSSVQTYQLRCLFLSVFLPLCIFLIKMPKKANPLTDLKEIPLTLWFLCSFFSKMFQKVLTAMHWNPPFRPFDFVLF